MGKGFKRKNDLISLMSKMLVFLVAITMFQLSGMVASAENADISGHWAQETLAKWAQKGWLNGNGEGEYRPNDSITRAEFMALMNRMKGYTEPSKHVANFSDVPTSAWYYNTVAVALEAGYVSGTGASQMSPENPITRQEAMKMIANVSGVDVSKADETVLSNVLDEKDIDSWARKTVATSINEGYVTGLDGNVSPKANITRGESVVLMDRINENIRIYAFKGSFGPTNGTQTASEITITAPDVTLHNMKVTGDIIVAKSVDKGDVSLRNIKLEGKLNTLGSGIHNIYLDNCAMKELTVEKDNVRVVLENSSSMDILSVLSKNNTIEAKGTSKIQTLTISGKDTTIKLSDLAQIITLNAQANNTKINTQATTTIDMANLVGTTTITGQGTIVKANIQINDCTIEKKPAEVMIGKGVSAMVNGTMVKGESTTNTSSGGGGGGGGGGSVNPIYQKHNIANKTVSFGTQIDALALPTSVILTANTNATGTANVSWNTQTYKATTPGTYTIIGSLSGATVSWAPASISVAIVVQEPLTVTGGINIANVIIKSTTSEAEAKAKLPQTLIVTLSDNSLVEVSLVWSFNTTYNNTAGTTNSAAAVVFGLPATVAVAPTINAQVIIAANDTPTATTVTLKATPANVQRPTTATPAKVVLSAVVKDQFGDVLNGQNLTFALQNNTDSKITYNLESMIPTITIKSESTAASVEASVTIDSTTITDAVTINITDVPIVPATLTITDFVSSIILPTAGNTTPFAFSAQVKDHKNGLMAEAITWSLKNAITGVSIDQNTGIVTVLEQATNGESFIVVATSGSLSAEKTVTIAKAASVPTNVTIIGADKVTKGSTNVYSALILDQYGLPIIGQTVTWTLENLTGTDATIDQNGTVKVNSSTFGKNFIVKASIEGKSNTMLVTIMANSNAVAAVKNVRFISYMDELYLQWDPLASSDLANIAFYDIAISDDNGLNWEEIIKSMPPVNNVYYDLPIYFTDKTKTSSYRFKITSMSNNDAYLDSEVEPNITLHVTENPNPVNITSFVYDPTTKRLRVKGSFTVGNTYIMRTKINTTFGWLYSSQSVVATNATELMIDNNRHEMSEESTITVQEVSHMNITNDNASFTISVKQTPLNITFADLSTGEAAPTVENIRFVTNEGKLSVQWDKPADTSNIGYLELSLFNEEDSSDVHFPIRLSTGTDIQNVAKLFTGYFDTCTYKIKVKSIGINGFSDAEAISDTTIAITKTIHPYH